MQWEVGLDCKHCWLLDYEASNTNKSSFPTEWITRQDIRGLDEVKHNLWVIPTAFLVHGVAGPLPGTGHTCTTRQPAIEFQLCLLAWTKFIPRFTTGFYCSEFRITIFRIPHITIEIQCIHVHWISIVIFINLHKFQRTWYIPLQWQWLNSFMQFAVGGASGSGRLTSHSRRINGQNAGAWAC